MWILNISGLNILPILITAHKMLPFGFSLHDKFFTDFREALTY